MLATGTPDLNGLKVALSVEAAGNWREYNDGLKPHVTDEAVQEVFAAIQSVTGPTKMPPDTRLLRLLVDAAAALHGEEARGYGWRILGIEPKDGRRYLGTGSHRVDWPVWFTAVSFGLGLCAFEQDADYLADDADE